MTTYGRHLTEFDGRISPDGEATCCECTAHDGFPLDAHDWTPVFIDTETDYPVHCSRCGRLFETSLTDDGVAYIRDEWESFDDATRDEYRDVFRWYGPFGVFIVSTQLPGCLPDGDPDWYDTLGEAIAAAMEWHVSVTDGDFADPATLDRALFNLATFRRFEHGDGYVTTIERPSRDWR